MATIRLLRYAPAKALLSAACALGCLVLSCGTDHVSAPATTGSGDSLKAVVEGLVLPIEQEADIMLTRGDSTIRTITRKGNFQLPNVDYGLYILDVRAKGYGGRRTYLSVNSKHVLTGPIQLVKLPWPVSFMDPQDSLVFSTSGRDSIVTIEFAYPMDRSSVEAALDIEPKVDMDIKWGGPSVRSDFGETVRITLPMSVLAIGKKYQLTLDTSAKTAEGQYLERPLGLIIRKDSQAGQPLARFLGSGYLLGPTEPIEIGFSESMDLASVAGRIYVTPASPFHSQWDYSRNVLQLIPDTRWPPGSTFKAGINAGYASLAGTEGGAISKTLQVGEFTMLSDLSYLTVTIEETFETEFNLPVDSSSVDYSVDSPVKASFEAIAPGRLRWIFIGATPGIPFTLRIKSVSSMFGDSLGSPIAQKLILQPAASNFRIQDSARVSLGLSPVKDSLNLSCSRVAYQRMNATGFSVAPFYPFQAEWSAPSDENAVLHFRFLQPVPSGTAFKLFPKTSSNPGDTASFSTKTLAPTEIRPFYGANTVAPGEDIIITWNSLIDTSGFAGHLVFAPAVDTVLVEHATSNGLSRTIIHHNALSKATGYTLRISGVTDLFSRPMADTLETRFRTAP